MVASISSDVVAELPEDLRAAVVMDEVRRADLSALDRRKPSVIYDSAAEKAMVEGAPAPVKSTEALWEWCRCIGVSEQDSKKLPGDAWGVYGKDQNSMIERAFQDKEGRVEIAVGLRKYEVIFSKDPSFALQEDSRLKKRRLVRRRVVSRAEYEKAMNPPPAQTPRGEDTCALCAEEFAETAHMPTIALPECQHVFHQACLRELADERQPCPVCRREIDWRIALPRVRG